MESSIERYLECLAEADQAEPVADDAKAVLGTKKLEVVADRGYDNGEQIRNCELAGIDAYVPKPRTSPNKAKGLIDRSAFNYVKKADQYECPAGQRLTCRTECTEGQKD